MLKLITEKNSTIFESLAQDYEEEFSSITGKSKQPNGKYSVDVEWHSPNVGYYWEEDGQIMGFVIKDHADQHADIGEFYVAPAYRKKRVGRKMAFAIFNEYPGLWQVRQIQGADLAKKFWRAVINEYTSGNYVELELQDPIWGKVSCQRFESAHI